MLTQKNYFCEICNYKSEQLSLHNLHLNTQTHKDKKELFKSKLNKLTIEELQDKYIITNITEIISNIETIETNKIMNILFNKELSNEYINMLKDTRIEETMSISNKDALKDKIHEIHNFLRNNGAGYGMNALKVFNIIYGLKKIEENNLLDKVNLIKPDCEFSYLLKLANENKDEKLAELIFGNVLNSISSSNIRDLLFYEIPQNIRGSVFIYLIKEINKITLIEKSCNVLLSGKIYEYFIGRDESAISELGAYFTDRHIVNYIYTKLKPSLYVNNEIGSMIDMFGGSGGFTTGYINYIKEHYNINWDNEINKIYHYDMNEDVIKSAGLEFFCSTGVLPNLKQLQYKNSFTDEFVGEDGQTEQKYKYVITNPPYGGDKNNKSETQIKRDKIKEYIKKDILNITDNEQLKQRHEQLKQIEIQEKQEKKEQEKTKVSLSSSSYRIQRFAKKYNLKGNDKEACSLMLMMELVEDKGTCIGVLKEGVFFNKTYKDIRKCLVENYNICEIISIPYDQFENTTTKTSIIIFNNTEEKTSKVKFSNLTIERYEKDKFEEINGYIYLIENKDDIKKVSDKLISEASKEDILKNNICSLNGKDYNKKEIVVAEDYELVRLGDICNFLPKSKRNASFGQSTGKYNFYTSSDKVQKCDIADYKEESLIIGSGGIANIKIDNIFSCSADNFIFTINNKLNNTFYNTKYVYYLLKGNMNLLIDGFYGSVLKHLSKEHLQKLELPIPKSEQKIKEWVNKISKSYNKKNENEKLILKLDEEIKNNIKKIENNEEWEEIEFKSLLSYLPKINKYKASDGFNNGLYKFYTSSQDKILYRDDYEFEDMCILIGIGGNPSIHLTSKFSVSNDVYVIKLKDDKNKELLQFIFYYLKTNINLISSSFIGSTIKHSSKERLSKIKLKIPKDIKLIKEFNPLFQKIEKLQLEITEADTHYKKLIKELSEEAIPINKQI